MNVFQKLKKRPNIISAYIHGGCALAIFSQHGKFKSTKCRKIRTRGNDL